MANTKEHIIETAIRLFVTQGFENTPTAQISKEADIATGTLFHHFKTKEEILNEAYLYVKKKMILAMKPEKELNAKEKLKHSWKSTIDYGNKHPKEIAFMMNYSGSNYITAETQKEGKKIFEPFTNIFEQGIKEKRFKELPTEILINTYYSILKGIHGCKKPDKKIIEIGFEMAWDAIRQ